MQIKLLYLIFLILYSFPSYAQFVQKGRTFEYIGNKPKQKYSDIVSIKFEGAGSTFNENGYFSLYFNELTKGDKVRGFDIKPTSNYVVFNRDALKRWILTPYLMMEIVLCKKDRIDNTIKIYTENQVAALNRSIAKYHKKLKELELDRQSIIKEKQKIQEFYEHELARIKANAIVFAYVDETELSEKENLFRNYVLKGENDSARIVANQIDYTETAKSIINNNRALEEQKQKNIDKLFETISKVEMHIDNIKSSVYDERWDIYNISNEVKNNLKEKYELLTFIYDYLLDEYTYRTRCDQSFLDELRNSFGITLLNYYKDCLDLNDLKILEKASLYGNAEAMLRLGRMEEDYNKSKYWFEQCLCNTDNKVLKDKAIEQLETFPDFKIVTSDKDTIYCHKIDNNNISICDYHPAENHQVLNIPAVVKYNKKKYNVKKIGYKAFAYYCLYGHSFKYGIRHCMNHKLSHVSSKKRVFTKVTIPYGVEVIGRMAFYGSELTEIKFPNSLKTIKDYAFQTCNVVNLIIPNGVEDIGKYCFDTPLDTLSLPSSLKKIEHTSFGDRPFHNESHIYVNPNNLYFHLKYNNLLSYDDSVLYYHYLPSYGVSKVFIPNKMNYGQIEDFVPWSNKEYEVKKNHPLYSVYKNVLYKKDFTEVVDIPHSINILYLHENLRKYIDISYLSEVEKVIIPYNIEQMTKYKFLLNLLFLKFNHYRSSENMPLDIYIGENLMSLSNIKMEIQAIVKDKHIDDSWNWTRLLDENETEDLGINLLKYAAENFNDSLANVSLGRYYTQKGMFNIAIPYYIKNSYTDSIISREISDIGSECESNYYDTQNYNSLELAKRCYTKAISMNHDGYPIARMVLISDIEGDYKTWKQYIHMLLTPKYSKWISTYNGDVFLNELQDTIKALKCYKMALCNGDSIDAPIRLGMVYYKMKKYQESYFYFKIALDRDTPSSDALNIIAYLYARGDGRKRNFAEALKYIDIAIAKNPENANYYDSKGEILLMKGDLSGAISMYKKTKSIDSQFYINNNSTLFQKLKEKNLIEDRSVPSICN